MITKIQVHEYLLFCIISYSYLLSILPLILTSEALLEPKAVSTPLDVVSSAPDRVKANGTQNPRKLLRTPLVLSSKIAKFEVDWFVTLIKKGEMNVTR